MLFYDPTKIAYINIAIHMCMHWNVLSSQNMFPSMAFCLRSIWYGNLL